MKHKGSQNSDTDTTTFQCISIAEAAEKDRLNRERKARNQRRYYQKYVDSTFLKAFRSIYWARHLVTKQSNNAKHDSRPVSKYLKSQSSHPYNPIFSSRNRITAEQLFARGVSTDDDNNTTPHIDRSADRSSLMSFTMDHTGSEPTSSSPPSSQHNHSPSPAAPCIADHAPLTIDHQAPNHITTTSAHFSLDDWPSWSASRRLAALRRCMLDMEWVWGSIANWPAKSVQQWGTIRE